MYWIVCIYHTEIFPIKITSKNPPGIFLMKVLLESWNLHCGELGLVSHHWIFCFHPWLLTWWFSYVDGYTCNPALCSLPVTFPGESHASWAVRCPLRVPGNFSWGFRGFTGPGSTFVLISWLGVSCCLVHELCISFLQLVQNRFRLKGFLLVCFLHRWVHLFFKVEYQKIRNLT